MSMPSVSDDADAGYEPSYRQQDVDHTLDDHERRIGRLEKVALVAVGYGLAEGSALVNDIAGLFL